MDESRRGEERETNDAVEGEKAVSRRKKSMWESCVHLVYEPEGR